MRLFAFCLALSSAAFLSGGLIPSAKAQGYKQVKDVNVACKADMSCSLSLTPAAYEGITGFTLLRSNQLDLPVELELASQLPITKGTRFVISIDGKDTLTLFADPGGLSGTGETYKERNPDVVRWVIEGMKKGSIATIRQSSNGRSISTRFSLSGAVAGMIFMDEYQDLLDTPLALHIKGNYEPNDRIPIRGIKGKQDVPRVIWANWYQGEAKPCSFFDDGAGERLTYGDGFVLKTRSGQLFGLPCGMGGAYNQPYAFFHVPDSDTKPIRAVPFLLDGNNVADGDMPEIWNMSFNARLFQLKSFFKGRGLGDCGTQSTWSLQDYQGQVFFEAVEIREKGDCDGNYAGGPDKWPVSWPVAD